MTKNETGQYILEKNALETSIFWYEKTIEEVNRQQEERRVRVAELRAQLKILEQEFKDKK